MKSSGELRQASLPRYRLGKKERIKPRIVKALAQKRTRRQNDARFGLGNDGEPFTLGPQLATPHAAQTIVVAYAEVPQQPEPDVYQLPVLYPAQQTAVGSAVLTQEGDAYTLSNR